MQITCMQKPGIPVYRFVSRQFKAAKVSPMKGSLTSAFVFLIRLEHTIRVSSKNKSLTRKARPTNGESSPQSFSTSLPISLGRLKDELII